MSNFQLPLTSGDIPTGNQATDTRGDVMLVKQVNLTFDSRNISRTLPPDAKMHRSLVINRQAVSGSGFTSGINVRVGTTANPNRYGQVAVSAIGTYQITLSAACVSAGGQIVIDATAQATAADWEEFGADVQIAYFSKSI